MSGFTALMQRVIGGSMNQPDFSTLANEVLDTFAEAATLARGKLDIATAAGSGLAGGNTFTSQEAFRNLSESSRRTREGWLALASELPPTLGWCARIVYLSAWTSSGRSSATGGMHRARHIERNTVQEIRVLVEAGSIVRTRLLPRRQSHQVGMLGPGLEGIARGRRLSVESCAQLCLIGFRAIPPLCSR